MSIDKLNQKLNNFFESLGEKKIQKTASLGHFADIKNDDDIKREAAMTREMLNLPKYQSIISRLRSATGVVNFVTHDEYQPLVELLIKNAFPSSYNDIFNFPTVDKLASKSQEPQQPGAKPAKAEDFYYSQVDTEQEYFVPPHYFNKETIQGDPRSVVPARNRLESLLLGSKVKMTRANLRAEGWTPERIDALLGKEPTPEDQQRRVDEAMARGSRPGQRGGAPAAPDTSAATAKGIAVYQYEMALKDIEARYDVPISELNRDIFEHQTGGRVYSNDEDYQNAKREREQFIIQRMEAIEGLNESQLGAALDMTTVGRVPRRSNDGFVNYNPKNNIKVQSYAVGEQILKYMKYMQACQNEPEVFKRDAKKEKVMEETILYLSRELQNMLKDAVTSNPKLKQIRDRWIAYLGNGKHEDFVRIVNGTMGEWTSLQSAYNEAVQKTGKVLLLDDFDKSAFCTKDAHGAVKLDNISKGIFSDFIGRNAGNLERDNSTGQKERGGRVVVIISSSPIGDLPVSAVVEMNMAPVDKQEAEIIVRNLYKRHMVDVQKKARKALYRELAEKYGNYLESEEGQEELAQRKEELDDKSDILGNISDDTRKALQGNIIGLGQKDAIESIRTAIETGKEVDPNDLLEEKVSYNEEAMVKNLKGMVSGKMTSGIRGLFRQEKEVNFPEYAYEEGSPWADQVHFVKNVMDGLKVERSIWESNRDRIKEITKQLKDPDMTREVSKDLINERNGLIEENVALEKTIEENGTLNLPHFYMLYGEPGVGKTVWGSALADLMKYDLFKVDIGDQKEKWVGNTGENANRLLNFLKTAQDTVFIMDEIDRQLATNDASPDQHQTDKELVAKLLEFFGNNTNDETFVKNRVYFIMTTNHIDQVAPALQSRASQALEVPEPTTPEAFMTLIRSAIKKLRKNYPTTPIDSIDWMTVAKTLSEKKIGLRFLEKVIKFAFDKDQEWQSQMKMFKFGKLTSWKSLGLPLTLPNLIAIAEAVAGGNKSAISELSAERAKQIAPLVAPYLTGESKFESFEAINPYTKKPEKNPHLKFPPDLEKIMKGEDKSRAVPAGEESAEGYSIKREIDPETGRMKSEMIKKDPAAEMDRLKDTGFEEQPLTTPAKELKEEQPDKKKKRDMGKKPLQQMQMQDEKTQEVPAIESSTDYLYNFLKKKGLIENDQVVSAQKKPVAKEAVDPTEELAQKGIFYFGSMMVAPATVETQPQRLKHVRK